MPLGLAIAFSSILRRTLYPLCVSIEMVPKIAFAPLFVSWLGFGLLPKVIIVILVCFFPIVLNSILAFGSLSEELTRFCRMTGAGWFKTFIKVRLPAAMPQCFVGFKYAAINATVGATIIFLIAKTSLGEPMAARAGPWLGKLRAGFQENALNYLLFLRLVPLFPFWLVNLAPGLLGVRLPTYLLGTFVGIIPGTFAFAFAGVGLDSVIEAQRAAYQACLAKPPADGTGAWSFTPAAPLGHDSYYFSATAIDVAGNTSAPSPQQLVHLDQLGPRAAPALDLAAASDTGVSDTDNITADTTPTFTGTSERRSTVTVTSSIDGVLGTTTAGHVPNTWSFTPAGALTEGTHTITVMATDEAWREMLQGM